jgi:hypothetical protein
MNELVHIGILNWPCYGSGGNSPPLRRGGLGSIPRLSMKDSWLENWQSDRVLYENFTFPWKYRLSMLWGHSSVKSGRYWDCIVVGLGIGLLYCIVLLWYIVLCSDVMLYCVMF